VGLGKREDGRRSLFFFEPELIPARIRIVHRFAERYGWGPETTLNLTDELRDGLLTCMAADNPSADPQANRRELDLLMDAVREVEAELNVEAT
jgi:hypothetical protein